MQKRKFKARPDEGTSVPRCELLTAQPKTGKYDSGPKLTGESSSHARHSDATDGRGLCVREARRGSRRSILRPPRAVVFTIRDTPWTRSPAKRSRRLIYALQLGTIYLSTSKAGTNHNAAPTDIAPERFNGEPYGSVHVVQALRGRKIKKSTICVAFAACSCLTNL